MANEVNAVSPPPAGLDGLAAAATRAGSRGLPPVHLWNPPNCGDIGLKIARDGTWFYQGSPIGRAAMVRLFSTILRKDPDDYVLVTPVEKVRVDVEDAPFVAVEMSTEGQGGNRTVRLRTNVEDWVEVGPDHPLRFEPGPSGGLKPYVHVRADLWALVSRPVFYDLVELGEVQEVDDTPMFGISAGGRFFPMSPADGIGELA